MSSISWNPHFMTLMMIMINFQGPRIPPLWSPPSPRGFNIILQHRGIISFSSTPEFLEQFHHQNNIARSSQYYCKISDPAAWPVHNPEVSTAEQASHPQHWGRAAWGKIFGEHGNNHNSKRELWRKRKIILENPGDVENAGAGASVEAWQTRSGGFWSWFRWWWWWQ